MFSQEENELYLTRLPLLCVEGNLSKQLQKLMNNEEYLKEAQEKYDIDWKNVGIVKEYMEQNNL